MMGSANEIKLGTVAELQCDPGYVPSGTDAIICEQHGWVPQQTLGNCTRVLTAFSNVSHIKTLNGPHFSNLSRWNYLELDEYHTFPKGSAVI